ncbi:transposase [Frankia sp. Hr75.2]|nr:transposase [Frankia sp. Hr75.2]
MRPAVRPARGGQPGAARGRRRCRRPRGCWVSTVLQAYRYALDPTPAQLVALGRHAGAARFAFNWGLARVKAAMDQRAAEVTYGVPEAERTPVPWTMPTLRRQWNDAKGEVASWWPECSKETYSAGLDQLACGLKAFSDSRKGRRKGRHGLADGGPLVRVVHGAGRPRPARRPVAAAQGWDRRGGSRGEVPRRPVDGREGAQPTAPGRRAGPAAPHVARLRPVEAGQRRAPQAGRVAGAHPRPGRRPAPRRPAQADHPPGDVPRRGGGRGSPRRRDGPQPPAGPWRVGHRHGRSPATAHLQDDVVRLAADRRGPLVPVEQDLFRLRMAKPKPHAVGPHVRLPGLRSGDRPRLQRLAEPETFRNGCRSGRRPGCVCAERPWSRP